MPYAHRPIYTMARGHSPKGYFGGHRCQSFFAEWVSRYGTPVSITTDRGTQFESRLFNSLARLIGCDRTRTTAYHPASNGMIERWHRSLKSAIMCHSSGEWTSVLPVVLLGLRTSIKEDIRASAAEMLYGATLRLPGEFFVDNKAGEEPQVFVERFRRFMRNVRSTPTAHHNKTRVFAHKTLHTCSHVFVRFDEVRRPLEAPYRGPYEVIERLSKFVFKISVDGIPATISTERLKPAFMENQVPPRSTSTVQPDLPAASSSTSSSPPSTSEFVALKTSRHSGGATVAAQRVNQLAELTAPPMRPRSHLVVKEKRPRLRGRRRA